MKTVFAALLCIALSGCMTPAQWAYVKNPNSVSGVGASNAQGACLEHTLQECFIQLFKGIRPLDAENAVAQIHRNDAVDVNGKPLFSGTKTISFVGSLTSVNSAAPLTITVDYNNQRIVKKVSMTLPSSPMFAQTSEDYNSTGIFEAMALVLGKECPSIDRSMAYKFFQNKVKPKTSFEKEETQVSWDNASKDGGVKNVSVPFCGAEFTYSEPSGHNTDLITLDNPSGVYDSPTIAFTMPTASVAAK